MIRKTVSILLTAEPNYDEYAFKYFILSLNKTQNLYEFVFPEIHEAPYMQRYYEMDALFSSFEDRVKQELNFEDTPDYYINIITSQMGQNLFFECRENVAFITTNNWEKDFSPPSLFEYLLHCIIACLLFMNEELDLPYHRDTKGCCLDYTYFKMDDRVDIVLGYICDTCREEITNNMGEDYLTQMSNVINRQWIGEATDFGSVSHNLKSFFKFDIDKDSGFNKTFFDKCMEHLYEIPKEAIVLIIGAIIGIIIAKLIP